MCTKTAFHLTPALRHSPYHYFSILSLFFLVSRQPCSPFSLHMPRGRKAGKGVSASDSDSDVSLSPPSSPGESDDDSFYGEEKGGELHSRYPLLPHHFCPHGIVIWSLALPCPDPAPALTLLPFSSTFLFTFERMRIDSITYFPFSSFTSFWCVGI